MTQLIQDTLGHATNAAGVLIFFAVLFLWFGLLCWICWHGRLGRQKADPMQRAFGEVIEFPRPVANQQITHDGDPL